METVIVGLGKTGLSFARFLAARGEPFVITDSRTAPPALDQFVREFPKIDPHLGKIDAQALQRSRRVLLSPGVALRDPVLVAAAMHGAEIIGDIELFARHVNAPVAAITGANGKSTVTTLVGEMAHACRSKVCVGGNLGTPALELYVEPAPDLYVLELSSFQLETVRSLNAAAATVLNITPDHMDRYDSLAEYSAAKQRIFRGNGRMILNADDPQVMAMQQAQRWTRTFTVADPLAGQYGLRRQRGETFLMRGEETLLPASGLKITGQHNYANALAALAMGEALDFPLAQMIGALREFGGLPHRCQWVAEIAGVACYNDSKGTNVGASLAAIQGLAQAAAGKKVVVILGGDGKGADFSDLAHAAPSLRAAVLIGRDAPQIERVLTRRVMLTHAADMDAAVTQGLSLAQRGDALLLSPACASFDMFRDYAHRGKVFTECVLKLVPA